MATIASSTNDQLMVVAAHRYCMGRRSYIVSSCQEWLKAHWDQFTENTKQVCVRDTIEALMDGYCGDEYNCKGWWHFARWGYARLSADSQQWVKDAVSHKKKPWPLDICCECGMAMHNCLCGHED